MLTNKNSIESSYGNITSLKFRGNSIVLNGSMTRVDPKTYSRLEKTNCKSKRLKLSKNVKFIINEGGDPPRQYKASKATFKKVVQRMTTKNLGTSMTITMKGNKIVRIRLSA